MIYLTRVDLEKGKRKNRGKNNIKGHQSKEYKGTPENTKGHPLSEIVRIDIRTEGNSDIKGTPTIQAVPVP